MEGRGNVNAGSGGGEDERSGGGVAIVGGSERSEVDEEERRHGERGGGRRCWADRGGNRGSTDGRIRSTQMGKGRRLVPRWW